MRGTVTVHWKVDERTEEIPATVPSERNGKEDLVDVQSEDSEDDVILLDHSHSP